MPTEPILGIVCPSVYDRSVVPAGHHTISIWVEYAPVGLAPADWESRRAQISDALIAQVACYAPNFPTLVSDAFCMARPKSRPEPA